MPSLLCSCLVLDDQGGIVCLQPHLLADIHCEIFWLKTRVKAVMLPNKEPLPKQAVLQLLYMCRLPQCGWGSPEGAQGVRIIGAGSGPRASATTAPASRGQHPFPTPAYPGMQCLLALYRYPTTRSRLSWHHCRQATLCANYADKPQKNAELQSAMCL